MSQQQATFTVTGDVEADVLLKSAELFQDAHGDKVELVVDTTSAIQSDDVFTIDTALAIATLISVLFKLVADLYERARRAQWDSLKFQKAIEAEMEKQSVQEYMIQEVANFGCLHGQGDCPCEVTVLSRASTKGYKILMFRDGKAFTFQIAHHLGL